MQYMIDGENYIDVEEAAALLGVKKATLYAYVSRGVLHSYKQHVGRRRLYRRAEIEELRAVLPSNATVPEPDDRVIRDVSLPEVSSWAGDH